MWTRANPMSNGRRVTVRGWQRRLDPPGMRDVLSSQRWGFFTLVAFLVGQNNQKMVSFASSLFLALFKVLNKARTWLLKKKKKRKWWRGLKYILAVLLLRWWSPAKDEVDPLMHTIPFLGTVGINGW